MTWWVCDCVVAVLSQVNYPFTWCCGAFVCDNTRVEYFDKQADSVKTEIFCTPFHCCCCIECCGGVVAISMSLGDFDRKRVTKLSNSKPYCRVLDRDHQERSREAAADVHRHGGACEDVQLNLSRTRPQLRIRIEARRKYVVKCWIEFSVREKQ